MQFKEFYEEICHRKPYNWQTKVESEISVGRWKESLHAPTGAGKTDILEIWLYALYRSLYNNERNVPLRLWYVINRRNVVDEVYEKALHIQEALKNSNSLQQISRQICEKLAIENPLEIVRLRGGLEKHKRLGWLSTANQPTIITSTIDQIGSWLLFRAYGLNPKNRSICAGMVAYDSLIILDESHLIEPFINTLKSVQSLEPSPKSIPKTRTLELSATSKNQNQFPITEELKTDKKLSQKTNAIKRVLLKEVSSNEVGVMIGAAKALVKDGAKVVSISCNTVAFARSIFSKLCEQNAETILLNGMIRNVEREKIAQQYYPRLKVGRDRSKDTVLYVVNTQVVEVGMNLDFDAMVSQAAPLDCLIQRLGRVDRSGELGKTTNVIVCKSNAKPCLVYGERSVETFKSLQSNYGDEIEDLKTIEIDTDLYSDQPKFATLNMPLADELAQTQFGATVNLEPLLHGVGQSRTEINIVYRKELTGIENDVEACSEWLSLADPQEHELLTIPFGHFFTPEIKKLNIENRLVYRNSEDGHERVRIKQIKPGETIFVSPEFGCHDQFGWNPEFKKTVPDVLEANGKFLRLHPRWQPNFDLEKYCAEDGAIGPEECDVIWEDYGRSGKNFSQLTPDEKGIYFQQKTSREDRATSQEYYLSHISKVEEKVSTTAQSLNLSAKLRSDLELAARLHDLGKLEPRWQTAAYLASGKVLDLENPLAKTGTNKRLGVQPRGWQHELQSAQMIQETNVLSAAFDPDLVIHLVASHHGWSRPFGRLQECDDLFEPFEYKVTPDGEPHLCQHSYIETGGILQAERFLKLNKKYGYWGLAYLEMIFRLSDWSVS